MAVGTPLAATLLEKSVSPSNVTKHLKAGDKKGRQKQGEGWGQWGNKWWHYWHIQSFSFSALSNWLGSTCFKVEYYTHQ